MDPDELEAHLATMTLEEAKDWIRAYNQKDRAMLGLAVTSATADLRSASVGALYG